VFSGCSLDGVANIGIPVDGCRVAPYVNIPSMRLAFEHHAQHSSHSRASLHGRGEVHSTVNPSMAAAAAAAAMVPFLSRSALGSMFFYPTPHYGLNLALQQASYSSVAAVTGAGLVPRSITGAGVTIVSNKNSSIADLRMKAKKYSAALGL